VGCVHSLPPPSLSKSKYLAGCQCPKRLWLSIFAAELGTEAGASVTALMEAGSEIGRRAQVLFPGGVLVDDAPWEHDQAVARTRGLVADPSVSAIFEAAFFHEGVRVRVDVLERLPDGTWGLREVKSGTRVKDVHLHDAAVQQFVLEGAGLAVSSVEIVHVDGTYVRGEGDVDWSGVFECVDVTARVTALMDDVADRVAELHRVLQRAEAPAIEPDRHCFTPFSCEFWAHCTREKPADWVVYYLRGRPKKLEALQAAGIDRLVDVPDALGLPHLHARARDVLRSGTTFVSPELDAALAALGPPTDYLDFETVNPAVPPYPVTKVYAHIPFQWSLHRLGADGRVSHREFLADGHDDPRREFAETLLAAVGDEPRPIVVYSSFEAGTLRRLACRFPDLAAALDRVTGRLQDLLPIVRAHVYHAAFRGSFSIKAVAPALVAGFGYDDLDGVADGTTASTVFMRLAQGTVTTTEERELRAGLLAYCARDTQALAEVHRALRSMRTTGLR
jgi:predicted RecB family nuclease